MEKKSSGSVTVDAGQRGPAEHERRQQIVAAAKQYFQHYGYEKTTVAELAEAIGFSKAYIYKFFDSKQAIGEVVCCGGLSEISAVIEAIAHEKKPAADRLRLIFRGLARQSSDMFFKNRKMHDLAATSFLENWQSSRRHREKLTNIIEELVREGRAAGEFERKTPLKETAKAIMEALDLFQHPVLLQHRLDTADEDAVRMANLVLRSLAP